MAITMTNEEFKARILDAFKGSIASDSTVPQSAQSFLSRAAELLTERGKQYDTGNERSGPKVAAAFNAITGKDLTAAEVYLLLQIVKDVRQWQKPEYHPDSAEDSVSYAALKAEALAARQ